MSNTSPAQIDEFTFHFELFETDDLISFLEQNECNLTEEKKLHFHHWLC